MKFIIPMRPKPSPRPRTNGFMPRDYVKWKSDFGMLVPYTAKQNLSGLCEVYIGAGYARPSKQAKTVLTPVGDVDNIAKSVLDALQDCGVITNDRNVITLKVEKYYTTQDEIVVQIDAAG